MAEEKQRLKGKLFECGQYINKRSQDMAETPDWNLSRKET
jgi:hypothetical protein